MKMHNIGIKKNSLKRVVQVGNELPLGKIEDKKSLIPHLILDKALIYPAC